MEPVVLLGLVGLALADSTSVGTLGIPVFMLVHPRVRPRLVVLHLGVLALFYWVLGVVLLLAADALGRLFSGLDDNRTLDVVQLVVGVGMLLASFWPDTPMAKRRAAARAESGERGRWRRRLTGAGVSTRTVVSIALLAGVVEAASMLPYLGAVGLISASGIATAGGLLVLAGYVVVMSVPALLLTGVRMTLDQRAQPVLGRIDAWLTKHTGGALWWVVGIIGALLALDAASRLGLTG